MPLNLSDLKAWAPEIADLTESAHQAAANHTDSAEFYRSLITVSAWEGRGADAAKAAMEATARDHEAVADNISRAAAGMALVGQEAEALAEKIKGILNDAGAQPAVQILEATNAVVPPNTRYLTEEYAAQVAAKVTDLQQRIAAVIVDGERLDADLAAAIATATGSPRPAAKPAPSLSDMLMPGSGGNRNSSTPPPNDLTGALDQIAGPPGHPATHTNGQPAGSPAAAVQLKQSDLEQYKATARRAMEAQGVAPDEIERRLDSAVAAAQRPSRRYTPPTSDPMPPPGFAEGFGDRWFATEEGLHDLLGQNGMDEFKESWEGLAEGTAERLTDPVGATIGDVQDALNSPSAAYYLGERAADVATTAPTLIFGGEGAAVRVGLPAELVTEGGAPAAVLRGWNPAGSMPWDEFESRFGTPGSRVWPENDGFPPGYVPQPAQLPEGSYIDRFGSEYGRYLAPDGTPFANRSLAPESVGGDYNRYMVTGKPLPPGWDIVEGPVAPWYGQTPSPGTPQYMIVGPDGVQVSVKELVDRGILDNDGPPLGR